MMNEETKASLNKFLKEREERIKNMTLAEARDTVSRIYGHSDMRMESDKALQMLLDCADEVLEHRWIPCSERFPEEHICDDGYIEPSEYVLICDDLNYCHVSRYWGNRRNKRDYKDWVDADLPTRKIKAWMQLPKPYKAERGQNDL